MYNNSQPLANRIAIINANITLKNVITKLIDKQ